MGSTIDAAKIALTDMCNDALADATEAAVSTKDTWAVLEDEPHAIELDTFFEGGTFLNSETGNFQQDSDMGGQKILQFNGKQAKSAYLSAPTIELEGGCPATNTAVCCWHRDRQYFDNNGNCSPRDCANQMPGDNTDLCWTEGGDDSPHPYPGSVTEGDLHCHGFAWSTLEETEGEVNTNAKWNNLFLYCNVRSFIYSWIC